MQVTAQDLQNSYLGVIGNLTALTDGLRKNTLNLKIHDLKRYFTKDSGWELEKTKSGHRKLTHKVTKIVIEYQAHSSTKDRTVRPHIQAQLLDQVQKHINILGNDIFLFTTRNWSNPPPNFNAALITYNNWLAQKHGVRGG